MKSTRGARTIDTSTVSHPRRESHGKHPGLHAPQLPEGAGLGAAGLAAVGLAGCSPSQSAGSSASGTASSGTASSTAATSWRTAPEPIAEGDIAETAECDVLVIGLSFSGCSAFRAAAESGAKVIAMEAHPEDNHPCMGMGHFGHINSEFLKERGVDGVDPIEFLNNWQLRAANRSNVSLARKFTTTCGEAFDWYIDCLTDEERDALEIQFYPTDEAYTTFKNGLGTYIGTASTMPVQEKILANLLQVGLDAGAQIYWGCPARQFLTADDGRVTGAVGQKEDGSYVQVNAAKGVIVCAGDYSANPEMAKELLSQITNMIGEDGQIVTSGYEGDGLKLCYWAGGQLDPYQSSMGGDYYYPCDSPADLLAPPRRCGSTPTASATATKALGSWNGRPTPAPCSLRARSPTSSTATTRR